MWCEKQNIQHILVLKTKKNINFKNKKGKGKQFSKPNLIKTSCSLVMDEKKWRNDWNVQDKININIRVKPRKKNVYNKIVSEKFSLYIGMDV